MQPRLRNGSFRCNQTGLPVMLQKLEDMRSIIRNVHTLCWQKIVRLQRYTDDWVNAG